MEVKEVTIKKITGNPYQTRLFIETEPLKVLIQSIRERGLFNPITVLEKNKNEYIVVHGHRRLEACKKLRWEKIPAFVKPRSEENSLITDLIQENLVREDLSVQEKALSIKLLFSQIKNIKGDLDAIISCISGGKLYIQRGRAEEGTKGSGKRSKTKWNDDDMFMGMKLLKTIGMSENNAISYLNVLKLPLDIQRRVSFNVHNDQGERSSTRISIRMANALARVDDAQYRDYLYERAMKGSTARHIDQLASNYKLKVLKGEWNGFVRKENNHSIIKELNKEIFLNISDDCNKLSRKLNTLKLVKLSALAEELDKEIFISSGKDLLGNMETLKNQLNKYLKDKGYKNVEKNKFNEIFEIPIRIQNNRGHVRGSIPIRMLRSIGISQEELTKGSFIQLKVVGIKNEKMSKV